MKVRWKGKTEFLTLTNGKIYDVLSIEKDWYRVIDDSDDDYLYPPELFDIVDHEDEERLRAEDKVRKYGE